MVHKNIKKMIFDWYCKILFIKKKFSHSFSGLNFIYCLSIIKDCSNKKGK